MKRIILEQIKEQEVYLNNIENSSHVGFCYMSNIEKRGFIIATTGPKFSAVIDTHREKYCNGYFTQCDSVQAAIRLVKSTYDDTQFFVFDTRKELYKWLSE